MKLKVAGKVYDLEEAIMGTELGTIRVMKKEYGWTMPRLAQLAGKMEQLSDPAAIFEDDELFDGFLVMIWLARVYYGENITLDEASKIKLGELMLVPDEDDKQETEPAPKEQTGSEADGAAPQTRPSKSKTSKPRSTRTSQTSATTGQG